MNAMQNHPTNDELTDFGLGKLDEMAAVSISKHLAKCDPCLATLAGLEGDTFIDLIGRADQVVLPTQLNDRAQGDGTERAAGELLPELKEHARYRTVELIGRGGMGDVYRAEHRLMNRTVALKVINRHLVASSAAAQRFQREVQAAAQLSHPNIVTSHDAEQTGDLHFLVMEHVEGTDLAEFVRQQGPLSIETACDWIAQAASGLQHAHDRGMVHRDIKPHNLMVTSTGMIKILDFGLATIASATEEPMPSILSEADSDGRSLPALLTRTGVAMGTPDFVSPEQVSAPRSADARSDIYSLGCTLYYLLTGRPPFEDDSVAAKLSAHCEREPRRLAELRSDAPPELCEVVERMMSKDPESRMQSASAVEEALRPWTCPKSPQPRAQGNRGRGPGWARLLIAMAGGLLLLAAATFIVLEWNKGTLTIESDADVVIRVMRRDQEYTRRNVTAGSHAIRIAAGSYEVEIEGEMSGLRVEDGQVTLLRGEQQVVRIVQSPTGRNDGSEPAGLITSGVVDKKTIMLPSGHRVDDEADALRAGNLAAHVARFNRDLKDHPIGKDQPRLTEDEVLTSIRWKAATDESFEKHPHSVELKRIVDSHFLPAGWTISGRPTEAIRHRGEWRVSGWEVCLAITSGGTSTPRPAHIIRQRALQPLRVPDSVEDDQAPDGMPLAAALRAFNSSQLSIDGKRQPPLTEDEVLAAIEQWQHRREDAPVVNRDFAAFQRIAATRMFPKETKFEVLRTFAPADGRVYYIYSVRIVMPKSFEAGTFAYTIREQFIRSRPETARDRAPFQYLNGGRILGEPVAWPPVEELLGTWKLSEAENDSDTITIARGPDGKGLTFTFKDVGGNTQQGRLSLPSRQPSRFVVVITEQGQTVREWFGRYKFSGDELTWEFNTVMARGSRTSLPPTDWAETLKQDTSPRHPSGTYRKTAGRGELE